MIEKQNLIKWYSSLNEKKKRELRNTAEYIFHSCALAGNSLSHDETKKLTILLEYCKANSITEDEALKYFGYNDIKR